MNLARVTNELSSIIPSQQSRHNARPMRLPKAETKPQRVTMAVRVSNDYVTSADPSKYILSRDVENEGTIVV